jgi:hypothetical protein
MILQWATWQYIPKDRTLEININSVTDAVTSDDNKYVYGNLIRKPMNMLSWRNQ